MSSHPGSGSKLARCADEKLCLAFVNTVAWRKTEKPEERLPTPAALLRWCGEAGIVEAGPARELLRQWERRPDEALACHRCAIELREASYGLFRSRVLGQSSAK